MIKARVVNSDNLHTYKVRMDDGNVDDLIGKNREEV